MAISFFIQFKLGGFAKQYAKWVKKCINKEAKRLRMRKLKQPKFKPHISLFGPAKTYNIREVISEVKRIGKKYTVVPFKLGGFDQFRNVDANWLLFSVYPSIELRQLRYELAQGLLETDKLIHKTGQRFDRGFNYKFHSSLGVYSPKDGDKFTKLVEYARENCTLDKFKHHRASLIGKIINTIKTYVLGIRESNSNIHLHLIRITVSGKGRREYDLVLKKLLIGREAWSRYWRKKTIEALKLELNPPKEESVPLSKANNVYLISDTHFGHKNVIFKFIHRPFRNTNEMNTTIKNNWNKKVSRAGSVYFLGDYTGPSIRGYYTKLEYWTNQLKGSITSIMGNHDRNGGCVKFTKARILHIGKYTFLLIHNPSDRYISNIKTQYDWIIHGHTHNNKMDRYPFINGEKRTINVSVELINYNPVSLDFLLSLDLDSIKRMPTIDSQPERW